MSLSWRIVLPVWLSIQMLPGITLAEAVKPSFTSPEHIIIGDQITLRLSAEGPEQAGLPLNLPNGLRFTYGEILAIPDFYSVVDQAVSLGRTDEERKARFMTAFNSFAVNMDAKTEANKITVIMHDEQKRLEDGIKAGEKEEDIYKKIGYAFDIKYNCVTGGGCDEATWLIHWGRYLSLVNSKSNYDHFGDNAIITYQTGHQLALEQAVLARITGDVKKLETAYAINAFACHFITDRFASGHMRTPRLELAEFSTPKTAGALLAHYMHNEENESGLHVYNIRGDHWLAFGDKSYFNSKSQEHLNIMRETLQNSADAVFAAYQQGSTHIGDIVMNLIPQPQETANASKIDVSPLFYWDNKLKKLMRRCNLSNYFDKCWKENWIALTTLLELQLQRGFSDVEQASLAHSEQRKQALHDGLITNPYLIEYVKNS